VKDRRVNGSKRRQFIRHVLVCQIICRRDDAMSRTTRILLACAGLSLLAACGQTKSERAGGGALTGAGTGAAVGALGGPVGAVAGAAIGAAAGAGTGASTTPSQINLGKPIYDNPNVNVGGYRPANH
jgi:hypothetical protein